MLFVVDVLANNGAMHIVIDLAAAWAEHGARLVVMRPDPAEGAPLVPPPEVSVLHLGRPGVRIRAGLPASLPRLLAAARAADVVVSGSEIGPALHLSHLAARVARRPFVIGVHADLDRALREYVAQRLHRPTYWVHRHATGAVCIDDGVAAPLVRNGLPAERMRVVRNGIDVAAVQEAARAPGSQVNADRPTVVATGRLVEQKGYDLLLRAHARALQVVPHEVLILNDGPDREALQSLAAELGVQGSVRFAGATEAPLPTVAAATVFCLPSRHEGLPLALLEALALGVPIIAADCSEGVRVALDHGRYGALVPVEDVGGLTTALTQHLLDPAPLQRLAEGGPERAAAYSGAAMVSGWARALSELAPVSSRRRT